MTHDLLVGAQNTPDSQYAWAFYGKVDIKKGKQMSRADLEISAYAPSTSRLMQ